MASQFAQAFLVILAIVLLNSCFAQLTFTPNWGKRSGSAQLEMGNSASTGLNTNGNSISDTMFRFGATRNSVNQQGSNCKPSVDSVMLIYRLIQAEADKMDECAQKSNSMK